ncbi:hypothetical protein M9H77_03028 [Catharanthus roseus]|uniref:Uncharacterized protein n=1 Tax=Catharanthus roseus TaxID=4058 RepID=A0ACC0CA32_CATRO|nr:hypothetical protein M9H77_03028 [Catharanthus roseus]
MQSLLWLLGLERRVQRRCAVVSQPLFQIQGEEGTIGSMDPESTVVHSGFGRCTTYWGGLSISSDLGVVAYTCIAAQLMAEIQADPLAPFRAIWCTSFDCSQLPTHILVTYRDQLDFIPSDQFIWLHYYDRPLISSELWQQKSRSSVMR